MLFIFPQNDDNDRLPNTWKPVSENSPIRDILKNVTSKEAFLKIYKSFEGYIFRPMWASKYSSTVLTKNIMPLQTLIELDWNWNPPINVFEWNEYESIKQSGHYFFDNHQSWVMESFWKPMVRTREIIVNLIRQDKVISETFRFSPICAPKSDEVWILDLGLQDTSIQFAYLQVAIDLLHASNENEFNEILTQFDWYTFCGFDFKKRFFHMFVDEYPFIPNHVIHFLENIEKTYQKKGFSYDSGP